MVQLLVKIVTPPGRTSEIVLALRSVMHGAQQLRGCDSAEIHQQGNDGSRVEYSEEWADEAALREQFQSERFVHLLELVETSVERPSVEFRVVSATYGLEYITSQNPKRFVH